MSPWPHLIKDDFCFLVTDIQAAAFNDDSLRKGVSGFLWKNEIVSIEKGDDTVTRVEQLRQSKDEAWK